ncbi:unnamed protein product [Protopolystoma xenopodis]|uniref:Uncharacterized protein n=1 Tax=Protopolystoma xenopodis TaxID=117903 RepID=A0A3S5A063_9PLAT|nr:unnamed protein product [Protopolystoma xenopodis]
MDIIWNSINNCHKPNKPCCPLIILFAHYSTDESQASLWSSATARHEDEDDPSTQMSTYTPDSLNFLHHTRGPNLTMENETLSRVALPSGLTSSVAKATKSKVSTASTVEKVMNSGHYELAYSSASCPETAFQLTTSSPASGDLTVSSVVRSDSDAKPMHMRPTSRPPSRPDCRNVVPGVDDFVTQSAMSPTWWQCLLAVRGACPPGHTSSNTGPVAMTQIAPISQSPPADMAGCEPFNSSLPINLPAGTVFPTASRIAETSKPEVHTDFAAPEAAGYHSPQTQSQKAFLDTLLMMMLMTALNQTRLCNLAEETDNEHGQQEDLATDKSTAGRFDEASMSPTKCLSLRKRRCQSVRAGNKRTRFAHESGQRCGKLHVPAFGKTVPSGPCQDGNCDDFPELTTLNEGETRSGRAVMGLVDSDYTSGANCENVSGLDTREIDTEADVKLAGREEEEPRAWQGGRGQKEVGQHDQGPNDDKVHIVIPRNAVAAGAVKVKCVISKHGDILAPTKSSYFSPVSGNHLHTGHKNNTEVHPPSFLPCNSDKDATSEPVEKMTTNSQLAVGTDKKSIG